MTLPLTGLKAPYYAVIFTNKKRPSDSYGATAERMVELAAQQPGYLGIESISNGQDGVTVSYWRSEDDIRAWKKNLEHVVAQKRGRDEWYESFSIRVCKVERSYDFSLKA